MIEAHLRYADGAPRQFPIAETPVVGVTDFELTGFEVDLVRGDLQIKFTLYNSADTSETPAARTVTVRKGDQDWTLFWGATPESSNEPLGRFLRRVVMAAARLASAIPPAADTVDVP